VQSVDQFSRQVRVILSFTQPHKDLISTLINVAHQAYLVVPFLDIILVDAQSVNPQFKRFPIPAESPESGE
jgi:hypothetical protein